MPDAHAIVSKLRSGSGSPIDILEASLARIDALEPLVKAWVHVDRDAARETARRLAETPAAAASRALFGVPVALKDVYDAAGMPTRLGAPEFAHSTPQADATAVARLRAAGAVILGKTTTTEFEFLDPTETRNPWNLEHTPGGSSSGSAAAVAAGMVPIALGSQTVGSVLRPAGYCGIVGLKPSHGLISAAGAFPLAPSFDHVGVLCRSVLDAATALGVIAGYDPAYDRSTDRTVEDYVAAATASSSVPRVGLARSFYEGVADDEVSAHVTAVAERLRLAGAQVREVEMPATLAAIAELGQPVLRAEAAAVHARWFAAHRDGYREHIRGLVEAGLATRAVEYVEALDGVRRLRRDLIATLDGLDVIMLPPAASTAPAGYQTGSGAFCAPASFTGLPSIALPSGVSADRPAAVRPVHRRAVCRGAPARMRRLGRAPARLPRRAADRHPVSSGPAYRAVVFDFDLTLADSSAGFVACHRFAAERFRLPPPDALAVKRTIGTPLPIAVPRLYGAAVEGVVEEYIRLYQEHADAVMTDLTVMLDGAVAAVRALGASGLRLGIVSQKLRYRVEEVLRREDLLDCFDVVIGAEDTPALKPDPRGLLAAVARLGVEPAEALYVGDTIIDAQAAHNAGMPFAAVLTGATTREEFAPYPSLALLESVRDLPDWLGVASASG